jgi:hypothetical protein
MGSLGMSEFGSVEVMPIVNCIVPQIVVPQKPGVITAINGRSVTNLITNGNFAKGTTGWIAGGSTVSVASNTLTVTGNGSTTLPQVGKNIASSLFSHIFYIISKVRVTNSSCIALSYDLQEYTGTTYVKSHTATIQNSPVSGTYYNASARIALSSSGFDTLWLRIVNSYADTATANGKVMEVQNVMAIDLLTTFGLGNEPTTAQCDSMFATWFDGTTVI